jgi:hypothetical protein
VEGWAGGSFIVSELIGVKGSATVLRGKGKIGIFQEEVGEDDKFAHKDGEGEFFGFAGCQSATRQTASLRYLAFAATPERFTSIRG